MNTDQNGRILCNCGRVMHAHSPKGQLGAGDFGRTIRLSCPTHGIMHTLRVIEELPA